MKKFTKLVGLCIAVTIACFYLLRFLVAKQGIELSIHGEIAMALGVFFTMLIGVGLMALLFHSSRAGHDQMAHGHATLEDDAAPHTEN